MASVEAICHVNCRSTRAEGWLYNWSVRTDSLGSPRFVHVSSGTFVIRLDIMCFLRTAACWLTVLTRVRQAKVHFPMQIARAVASIPAIPSIGTFLYKKKLNLAPCPSDWLSTTLNNVPYIGCESSYHSNIDGVNNCTYRKGQITNNEILEK